MPKSPISPNDPSSMAKGAPALPRDRHRADKELTEIMALLGETSEESPPVDDEDLAQLLEGLGATAKEREEAEVRELLEGLPELNDEAAAPSSRGGRQTRAESTPAAPATRDVMSRHEEANLRELLQSVGDLGRPLEDSGDGMDPEDASSEAGDEALDPDVLSALKDVASGLDAAAQELELRGTLGKGAKGLGQPSGDAGVAGARSSLAGDAAADSPAAASESSRSAERASASQANVLALTGAIESEDDAIEALEAEGEELAEDLEQEGEEVSEHPASPALQVRREALSEWRRGAPADSGDHRLDQIPASALRIGGEEASADDELKMPIDDEVAMALSLPENAGEESAAAIPMEGLAEITLELIDGASDGAGESGADGEEASAREPSGLVVRGTAAGAPATGEIRVNIQRRPTDPVPASAILMRSEETPDATVPHQGGHEGHGRGDDPEEPAEPVTLKELFSPLSTGLNVAEPVGVPTFLRGSEKTPAHDSEGAEHSTDAGPPRRGLALEPEVPLPPVRDPLASRKAVAGEKLELFMKEDVQTLLSFRVLRFFVMSGLERIQFEELQEEMVESREQLQKTLTHLTTVGLMILESGQYSLNTRARKLSLLGTAVAQWQTPRRREGLISLLKR